MHKIIIILFSVLVLATPVYAGSSFQYSRLIQPDNLIGYKSVVLDKEVYAHSNQLNDLRVINDKDEEIPYFLYSIRDASTEKEKENFILSEEAPYITTQDGKDSIITIEVNHLNAFYLELNTDDMFERNYGLFGISGTTKRYLSDGTLINLPLDSSVPIQKNITWMDTNPVDQLKLIIYNRDEKPINLKSVTIKYALNKLVFKDSGNSHYWLTYGNDTLRSPVYDVQNYKAAIKKEIITQSTLGAEVSTPPKAEPPKTPANHKLFFYITISTLVLLLIIGIRLRSSLRKKNPK